jgi:flagellar biosynthesis/type III secretory pathway protein FliH
MQHLHRDPRASSSNENGVGIENQQERKEGHNPNRRKGKKEGGREGKEGGREDGRKKETKAELQNGVHFGHVTFKELQVPSNLQMSVSKCGKDRAVYRF